jgi:predicted aconitase
MRRRRWASLDIIERSGSRVVADTCFAVTPLESSAAA